MQSIGDTALRELAGRHFPGGSYRIDPDQHRQVCALIGSPEPAAGVAHGIYAYIATRVGCGLSVDEILALAGATKEEGPMVGSLAIEFRRPLRVGETYAVAGEVTGLRRKHGRRIGTFDLLEFELGLTGFDGEESVRCTQSWVLPRSADARGHHD